MLSNVQQLGRSSVKFLSQAGLSAIFLGRTIVRRPRLKKTLPDLIEQIYSLGVLSLPIIIVSAMFIGMVVGLQGFNTLNKFGTTSYLGQLLALSITRELGPVITALLFAGRACSALTAEIGLMKTTEQLSSMEMMGVDPLWRVIYPRFWAGIISMPLLSIIFSAVAVYGGYCIGVKWLGIDAGSFWNNMQATVNFKIDVLSGIIKSIVFGFVASWIAVFQGFNSMPTPRGISIATTRTVVYASLAILGLDFVLTAMMIGGW